MVLFEPPDSHLTCFGRCCKGLVYLFNLIFFLTGIAAAVVGVWVIADPTSQRVIVLMNSRLYLMGAFILIGAGTMATFVAFIGCCAARYENRCLLILYAILLLLIFIAEFAAGVLSLAFYSQSTTLANMEMESSVMEKFGQANHGPSTEAWNYMQTNFKCCGFTDDQHEAAELYQISVWFETSLIRVPPSCCKRDEEGEVINLEQCLSRESIDLEFVYNVGCRRPVIEQGLGFATLISGVSIAISVFQLLGLVFAFCLFRRM